jgi:hypothetical protein
MAISKDSKFSKAYYSYFSFSNKNYPSAHELESHYIVVYISLIKMMLYLLWNSVTCFLIGWFFLERSEFFYIIDIRSLSIYHFHIFPQLLRMCLHGFYGIF